MTRIRRRFGPFFHVTVVAALATLASMPFWSVAVEQWQAWTFSRQLRGSTAAVREEAADGLVRLGPAATSWVIRAMGDPDAKVRLLACSILPRTDPDHPEPALDALAAALKDGDASVRKAAADQLWLATGALAARAGVETRGRVVGALRAALGDQAKDVRSAAAIALGAFGQSAKPAVVDLDRALSGPDPALRVFAAQALLRIDPSGSRPRVLSALRAMLADPSGSWEGWRVVQTLKAETGEDGAAAALIPLLEHKDMGIRHGAIYRLIDQCPGAEATRPAVVDALGSDDGGIRCEAALFLLKHDPGTASRALEELVEQLVNPQDGSFIQHDIIRKLREVSPDSVGRVAAGLIEPTNRAGAPGPRLNAILSLGVIGPPEAKQAVPALLEAASSDDRAVALRAAEALATIDPASAASRIPLLLEWIGAGEDVTVRVTAMATLGEIGPAAAAAVPALLEAADEEEINVSLAAIAALSKIDPVKAEALKRSIRR